ncbi:MAG TPA: sulfite reductase, partial [Verrucomicrobiae bacterium]|nr:sulfite reductase [Verrucomicrobiae bacterium]
GFKFEPAREFKFTRQGDLFGWHEQSDGRWFLGLFVEMGRIRDQEGYRLKSALRRVVEELQLEIRLTPSQNLIVTNVGAQHRETVNRILAEHGINVEEQATIVRRASMACPALPTCGLALAEAERYLPSLLAQFEELLREINLGNEEIIVRMTGCPNGCARPYMAEIGFVGKSPNKYQIYLGGNEASTRMNKVFRENVKSENILQELRPVLTRFAQEREGGERFGDYCARVMWPEAEAAAIEAASATSTPA